MEHPTDSSAPRVPSESLALPGGGLMPLLGFGTWQLTGDSCRQSTVTALKAGYRHLDTATMYANEREVGAAVRESGVPREDIFLTTKLPPDRVGVERETLEQSLEQLGVDNVDLWLVHWPPVEESGVDVWRAFLDAQQQGLARDIGVSNYSRAQLDELAAATGVMPAVNQIKWSPLLFNAERLAAHRERGVVLEGYSALRGGTLDHPVITSIAEAIGRTPAQVIIRWHLQHQVVVIPRSSVAERVRANADVGGFVLSDEQMRQLDSLG